MQWNLLRCHRQLGDHQAWGAAALPSLLHLTPRACLSIEKHQMAMILGRYDLFDGQCRRALSARNPDDVDRPTAEALD